MSYIEGSYSNNLATISGEDPASSGILDTLEVLGNAKVDGTLEVVGATYLNNTVDIAGNTNIGGVLHMNHPSGATDNIRVYKYGSVYGDYIFINNSGFLGFWDVASAASKWDISYLGYATLNKLIVRTGQISDFQGQVKFSNAVDFTAATMDFGPANDNQIDLTTLVGNRTGAMNAHSLYLHTKEPYLQPEYPGGGFAALNTVVGINSGMDLHTGEQTTIIGADSFNTLNDDGVICLGSGNTLMEDTGMTNCTIIDNNAYFSCGSIITNAIVIDSGDPDAYPDDISNQIYIGNSGHTKTNLYNIFGNGNTTLGQGVAINSTMTPNTLGTYALEIEGSVNITGGSGTDFYINGNPIAGSSVPFNPANNYTWTGVQTFGGSTPPLLSGANIFSATIPASALAETYVQTTGTETIGGFKTFSNAPVMSGAAISTGSIPKAAVSGTAVSQTGSETITGLKTFTTNGINIQSSAQLGISYTGAFQNAGTTTFTDTSTIYNQGTVQYTVSSSLTTLDSGRTLIAMGTGAGITLTLPQISTNLGFFCWIVGDYPYDTTLNAYTGDYFKLETDTGTETQTYMIIPKNAIAYVQQTDGSWSMSFFWSKSEKQFLASWNKWTSTNDFSGPINMTGALSLYGTQTNAATTTITATGNLSPTASGKKVLISSTGAITLTMPTIVSSGGLWYIIIGDNTYNTILSANTGNYFANENSLTLASITIPPKWVAYVFESPDNTTWRYQFLQTSTASYTDLLGLTNIWTGTSNTFNNVVDFKGILTTTNSQETTAIGVNTNANVYQSVCIGKWAGNQCTSSSHYNVVVGHSALPVATQVDYTTAIGYQAMHAYNTIGGTNTACGAFAGQNILTGTNNTFLGVFSGTGVIRGSRNLCVGECMTDMIAGGGGVGTSVDNNIAIGSQTFRYIKDGAIANVAIGNYALYTESYYGGVGSVAIGPNAGVRTLGSNNTFLGYCAQSSNFDTANATYSYCTTVGSDAIGTASNQVMLGRSSDTVVAPGTFTPNTANASPRVSYIVDTTITAAQSGYMIELGSTATASRTFTLPAPSTANLFYTFTNLHASNLLTLTTPSGIFNQQNGAGTTSVYVWPNSDIMVRSNGTNWIVEGGLWDTMRLSYESVLRQPAYFRVGGNPGGGVYAPFEQGANITATATLAAPLKRSYMITSTTSVNITLPVIASSTVGAVISFRKLSATINIAHNIIAGAANSIIAAGTGNTAVANPTSTPLLSATATALNYLAVNIVCISTTQWAIMA